MFGGGRDAREVRIANWVECRAYSGDTTIFVNLDQVVSLSGNKRATVVRYHGGENAEFVVATSPEKILAAANIQPLR